MCIEALLSSFPLGPYMPVWPFKKKAAEAAEVAPEAVIYERGENGAEGILTDTSHTEAADFQAAMTLFSSGAPEKDIENKSEDFTWVAHDDGYHYKKNSDGSFQETPHVKDGEGNYTPHS